MNTPMNTPRLKLTSLKDRDPFRLGIATLAVLLAVGAVVVVLSVVPFGKHTYTAVLEQSAGLRAKEDVQVAGVRVGEVRSVDLVGHTVHVRFTVDDSVHLGRGTTAAVKVATLLGTHLLMVTPHGSGQLPHDTIPLAHTSVPFNLQDVLGQGTERLEELSGKKLARMLTVMTDELSPSSRELGPALHGVVRFSDLVSRRSGQIGDLLTAARRVTRQLSESSPDLVALMKQTDLVVSEITARRHAVHTLLVQASRLSDNLVGLIGDTRADTKPALRAIDGALRELHRQDRTLRYVLDTMAPAVRYVANATGNAPYGDLFVHPPLLPPNDTQCALLGEC